MSLPLLHVDAFTSAPFGGNPAAVCLLPSAREAAWMQAVAREMNLSATAFLVPEDDGHRLRWFTRSTELELCGHATLATAHVLWETGRLPISQGARFQTRGGMLTASRQGDWIELNFPATPPAEAAAPDGLMAALGLTSAPRHVARSKFDYLVEVESEAAIRGLTPDFARLRTIDARGVMVTSRASTAGVDFVSRFFAPGAGIDEDPATGSSHCCMTPYWSRLLNKKDLIAHQLSARGGVLSLTLDGDRVRVRGQAVTVFRGDLVV